MNHPVTWVVQSNFLDRDQINPVVEALKANDIPYHLAEVIPFSDEFNNVVPEIEGRVIPYGATSLVKNGRRRGWSGVYFNEDTFSMYAATLNRNDMLNQHSTFMRVKELADWAAYRDPEEVWFIRPNKDLKEFNGTITTTQEIGRWMSSVDSGNFSFDNNTMVMVSKPQEILMEWRHFVVDRKIVTSASYRFKGLKLTKRETDPEVIREAQNLCEHWLPDRAVVMDTALTKDGLRVVEFNNINSSGFYYHDIEKFVTSLTEYEATRSIVQTPKDVL